MTQPFVSTIGTQKTPANPVDVLYGPSLGLPTVPKGVILIAAMGPTGGPSGGGSASGTQFPYTVVPITNNGSVPAASAEAIKYFGSGTQAAKMVIAAVTAVASGSVFPPITVIPLPQGATTFGGADNDTALNVLDRLPGILYVATQFDGNSDTTNRTALVTEITAMSGALRTPQGQFGSFAVMANTAQATISSLVEVDSRFFIGVYMYDSGSNPYSVGQLAAAAAAKMAANPVPFNPQDNVVLPGVTAPADMSDWLTVGGGAESEAVLNRGWTPLRVMPNSTVAFVRTVTSRLTLDDGVTPATSYFDNQDIDTLYFFRDAVATRFAQPDFANQKASVGQANDAKGEVIRLMQVFEDQGMFQAVSQLSALVQVKTNPSQRGRFDVYVPVNVVPGLHEIATDVVGTTLFDQFTV